VRYLIIFYVPSYHSFLFQMNLHLGLIVLLFAFAAAKLDENELRDSATSNKKNGSKDVFVHHKPRPFYVYAQIQ